MLKQSITIAWRNLLINKYISAINILGLAAGIAACILIFLYVDTELRYDKDWNQAGQIYRINETVKLEGKTDPFSLTDFNVGPMLQQENPSVEHCLRLFPAGLQTAWIGSKGYDIEGNFFADSTFFQVFNMPLAEGNPETALSKPKTIVISDKLSKRLFGDQPALGKSIRFSRNTYQITGVIRTGTLATHLDQVNTLLSMKSLAPEIVAANSSGFLQLSTYTYLKFKPGADLSDFETRMAQWVENTISPWLKTAGVNGTVQLIAQPVSEIHFDHHHIYDFARKGNRNYVIIFGFVALFLLLIGCFNYMNLTTARNLRRTKEVAIRKVAGATKSQLMKQFLGESIITTLIALLISIVMVELLLPGFNRLTDHEISLSGSLNQIRTWLILLSTLLFTGVLGGFYPALVLSFKTPDSILRGGGQSNFRQGSLVARSLVVLQFGISVGIISATAIVMLQLDFMRHHDLGFSGEQVAVLSYPASDTSIRSKISGIRQEFLRDPHFKDFATGDHLPGSDPGRLLFSYNLKGKQESQPINITFADYDYFRLLNIKLKNGRTFSREFPGDKFGSFVINEACARFLGLEDPLGKELQNGFMSGRIIGVVEDYHYASLHHTIDPMVFMLPPTRQESSAGGIILLKMQSADLAGSILAIESKWKQFFPKHPPSYFFLDESFNRQYRKEETMLKVFTWFALLTILISSLGLFALAYYSTQRRTKEIGIRKVLGASANNIILMIVREFGNLVILAILLAMPITWYLMNDWLHAFAFRINIPWWIFGITGSAALLVATATVSWHAFRSAYGNPVQALRYE